MDARLRGQRLRLLLRLLAKLVDPLLLDRDEVGLAADRASRPGRVPSRGTIPPTSGVS